MSSALKYGGKQINLEYNILTHMIPAFPVSASDPTRSVIKADPTWLG
jgi:hypothetical protein